MNENIKLIEAHIVKIENNNLKFLVMKRSQTEKYPGVWQMVTGSVEDGEKAWQAALREIKEETGITPQKFWVVPNVNSFYSQTADEIIFVPVFVGICEGNTSVLISQEHDEYKWADEKEAIKLLAWPGQHKSVETINEFFTVENNLLKFIEIDF